MCELALQDEFQKQQLMHSIKAPIGGWEILEHFSHQRGSDLHLPCDRYGLKHMIGQAGNILIGLKQNCDEKLLKFAVMFVDGSKMASSAFSH